LGLPIVLEIAHQHGATVDLQETHPGHNPPGAQFSVVFTKT
jgi:two-component system sensor histidine kinase TctE